MGTILIFPKSEKHLSILKKNVKSNRKNKDMAWFFMFALGTNCGICDIVFNLKNLNILGSVFRYI